jgi:serine/threonine protein kinase
VVGLGIVVAATTGLQAVQSAEGAQTLRPYAIVTAVMTGLVAVWQLVAGLILTPGGGDGDALTKSDPRRVGPYRIIGRLGAGAMGRAYLGVGKDGRPVAVKVIRSEYADSSEFRRRFAREITAIQKVHGQYTVDLMAADPHAEQPWMATSFVSGPSLQQAIETHGGWSAASVWKLAAGVADALAAIHAAGLVHRDLKPANILLAESGPRIIDFGIAHVADASQLTATMHRPGTPAFMAPEQALGGDVGPAADVFALGVVLAYTVTGRPPFGEGASDVVLYRIIHHEPDLTGIDAELQTLVEDCLAKEPGERPTPADIIARSRLALAKAPSSGWLPAPVATDVTNVGIAPRAVAPARARRSIAPVVIAATALVIALASAAWQIRPLYASDVDTVGTPNPRASSSPSASPSVSPSTSPSPSASASAVPSPSNTQSLPSLSTKVNVPVLVGLTKSAAITALRDAGLLGDFGDVDSAKPKDTVVSTTPGVGSIVNRSSTVKITISRGNKVVMPNLLGLTTTEADNRITAAGIQSALFTPQIVSEPTRDGIVVGQSPKAGTEIFPDGKPQVRYGMYASPGP